MSNPTDFMTFGPVHLDVIDADRSLGFWRDVVGLRLRARDEGGLQLGTEDETLLVLHPGATSRPRRGFSGLYHVAIHLPDEPEFARVLARLIKRRWPIAPTDHVMSKAIYLDDPDGIGLELTLETPERMGSMRMVGSHPVVIDSEGRERSGRDPLDVEQLLARLPDADYDRPVPSGTRVGHVHFHVGDIAATHRFYRDVLGLLDHLYAPQLGMADFHAGGRFPHRLALNTWQGVGAAPQPAGTAGLRHYTVRLDSPARLEAVLRRVPNAERDGAGWWVADPAGHRLRLTA
ncbi:VOC family protein [Longimicrobium sp.]|jgi:catechol 2,3-dioxygenase|uniref:VOC family protein n=1 Tax=Longimicrobium sp. TaxID=2029185 RepID=UPI002F92E903